MSEVKCSTYVEQLIQGLNQLPEVAGSIGACIGRGTYGFVCEWKDASGEQRVVKVLDGRYHWEQSGGEEVFDALLPQAWEYETALGAAASKCPYLMKLCAPTRWVSLDGNSVGLLVMPRLQTLQEYPLDASRQVEQAMRILEDCLNALVVLHAQPEKAGMASLLHNDLKPNNIFVQRDAELGLERFVVGDYSSCLNALEIGQGEQSAWKLLSKESGNPYLAPGERCYSADLWSLGWVLWYWLNGKRHPDRETVLKRIQNARDVRIPPLEKNPALWELFLKLTAPEPGDRYQSAEEALVALEKVSELNLEQQKKEIAAATREKDVLVFCGAVVAVNLAKAVCNYVGGMLGGKGKPQNKKWPDGTRFEGVLRGDQLQGTMFFAGGRSLEGNWQQYSGGDLSGIFCQREDGLYGCGRLKLRGGAEFEGAFWQSGPLYGWMRLSNRDLKSGSPELSRMMQYYRQFAALGGCFEGKWSPDGSPESGVYTFSSGKRESVQFVQGLQTNSGVYTGFQRRLNKQICGWGELHTPDQAIVRSEFVKGLLHGQCRIEYQPTGACFEGRWTRSKPVTGRLTLGDGRSIQSQHWQTGPLRLNNGVVARGLFLREANGLCGLGVLEFKPGLIRFEGEVFEDNTAGGTFRDGQGRVISEEEAIARVGD